MAEYIRREDALKVVEDVKNDEATRKYSGSLSMIADSIDGLPAADVVERKTGKWRRYSPLTDTFECDQCGYQVIDKEFRTNFCPNCGCAMEGTK